MVIISRARRVVDRLTAIYVAEEIHFRFRWRRRLMSSRIRIIDPWPGDLGRCASRYRRTSKTTCSRSGSSASTNGTQASITLYGNPAPGEIIRYRIGLRFEPRSSQIVVKNGACSSIIDIGVTYIPGRMSSIAIIFTALIVSLRKIEMSFSVFSIILSFHSYM